MQIAAVPERPNLSEAVAASVRRMIVDGALQAGERINEVHLAEALKVSRTPLREALNRLVAEGAIVVTPRRGFFVAPMTTEELGQLYDVRPLLDPEALRLGGVPSPKTLDRLDRINREIAEAADAEAAIDLDDAWHLTLLAHCPNRVLVGLIEQIMVRTRRYEMALMRDRPSRERATAHHDDVVAALRSGNLDAACAGLRANMTHGRKPILAWLRERLAQSTKTHAEGRRQGE